MVGNRAATAAGCLATLLLLGSPVQGGDAPTQPAASLLREPRAEAEVGGIDAGPAPDDGRNLEVQRRYLDDRLALRATDAYGREVLGADRIITTPYLRDQRNWRREFGLDLDLGHGGPLDLSLRAGLADLRLPDTTGADVLSIGELTDWEENTVGHVGLGLGLLDGRLRYEGNLSRSSYRQRSDRFDLGEERDPQTGVTQSHRLNALVAQGASFSLSVQGLWHLVDPSYEDLGNATEADLFAGPNDDDDPFEFIPGLEVSTLTEDEEEDTLASETRQVGGALDIGPLRLSLAHGHAVAPDHRSRKLGGTIELSLRDYFGASSVPEESGSGGDHDPVDGAEFLDDDDDELLAYAEMSEDADPLDDGTGGPGLLWSLVPGSLSVTGSRRRIDRDDDEDGSGVETKLGAGLIWTWNNADLSIDVAQTGYDGTAPGFGRTSAKDRSLDVFQSFYGANWDLSLYLSLGRFESADVDGSSAGSYYAGGAFLSIEPERLPGFTAWLDINRDESADRFGFPSRRGDVFRSRSESWSLYTALDLSKDLPLRDTPHEPYLRLTYRLAATSDRDSGSGSSGELGHAFTVAAGLRF